MTKCVDVQFAVADCAVPASQVTCWVARARQDDAGDVCVRFVNEEESAQLNSKYRRKSAATNVLAFPAEMPGLLGDLAVCYPLAETEAEVQKKSLVDHLAHLIVHGTLHLRGFTHDDDDNAEVMERLEVELLNALGIADPYKVNG